MFAAGRIALSLLCLGLVWASVGSAAVKPVRWLPSVAAAKAGTAFGVKVQAGGRYTPVVCKGTGLGVAGRFAAFRCSFTFRPGAVGTPVETTNVWVKVRPTGKGGACVSSSPVVSAACLRATAALSGDQTATAFNDFRAAFEAAGNTIGTMEVVCRGVDGWYACSAGRLLGVVVYTARGVKVTLL